MGGKILTTNRRFDKVKRWQKVIMVYNKAEDQIPDKRTKAFKNL